MNAPIRAAITAALAALVAGCSITVPVAVVSRDGRDVMHGTSTATLSGGSFEVAGPLHGTRLTCSGTYDSLDTSPTITIPVSCSDGRTGLVTAHRDPSGMDGSGTVVLNDGTEAIFVFGKAAANY